MQGKKEEAVVQELLRFIEDRFGIPSDVFDGYVIFQRKKGEFWITSEECFDFDDASMCSRRGFRFAQSLTKGGFRLSTHAIQLFGRHAVKNVVEVNEEEREAFIRGMDLKNRWGSLKGQVIVRYRGIPLGSAVVVGDVLKNQVPAARRIKASL